MEKLILLADAHADLPALQAVLQAAERAHPDRILSLGDQVNLGPCPRECLSLLREHHVTCLHGNHERYLLSVMRGEPGYEGANFASLRFFSQLLKEEEITFPESLRIGDVLFTHAMPGDDRFPVHLPDRALPRLRERDERPIRHIICGHGHDPRHYLLPGLTVDVVGSCGSMDDGLPGMACYAELLIDGDSLCLTPRFASFDPRALRPLFLSSGYAEACPIMARVICTQMETAHALLVPFVEHADALAKARGERVMSPETWREADRTFPWPDGRTTAAFWRGSI